MFPDSITKPICAICTDELHSNAAVQDASLVCGHAFHLPCINKWLQKKPECPNCRKRAPFGSVRKLFYDLDNDSQHANEEKSYELLKVMVESQQTELTRLLLRGAEDRAKLAVEKRINKEILEKNKSLDCECGRLCEKLDVLRAKYNELAANMKDDENMKK